MKQDGIFIASDFHCKYQKVAWMDTRDGIIHVADVHHSRIQEVRHFFSQFPPGSILAMESSGYSHWFEELLADLGLELKVGDPHAIAQLRRRRQKNDALDSERLLELLVSGRFPTVWRPSPRERQQRALLRHRCRLGKVRTQLVNALRALTYNYNLIIKRGPISQRSRQAIRELPLSPPLALQRDELLVLIEQLETRMASHDEQIRSWAQEHPAGSRLLTIPAVGPATALAAVLILGPIGRFAKLKSVVSYVGLDSCESSTNNAYTKRRYGSISKQGSRLLRWLLVQCAVSAARHHPTLKRFYSRLCQRKDWRVARTAVARKLLTCIYVLLRDGIDYPEYVRRGSASACLKSRVV